MDIFDGLTALGGLCLFLFGMQIMAEALQRRAGGRLEGLLRRMTRSRWAGFFTGLAVTAAVQSSSAAMVMVVGFVNSGMLTLRQAVGVIMGTNVGTTVTPWLLSLGGLEGGGVLGRLLRPAGFVPLLSLWGIAAYLAGKGSRRDTGQALLGFAVLMQGMEIMTAAVSGLARAEGFRQLFTAFGSPLLGVLAGAVLTAVIQSSSASVGILQALAASGQVTVGAAIPIVMGQNIGTCVTAMLSSVGASRSARRAALVHLLFNLAGAGIWLGVFWLVKLLAAPAILDRAVTLLGVAVIHTAFNLLCTAALFPAAGLLERAVLRLLPGEEMPSAEPDPRLLAAPAAALERCRELTLEMADLARDNLRRGIQALTEVHPDAARELRRQEERIDGLEDALGTFLVRLGGRTLTRRDSARAAELLMLMGDLERLGDHAMNLLESGEELRDRKIELPPEDRRQLRVLTEAVEEIADLALAAFRREDAAALGQVEALEQVIDGLRQRLRARRIRETQPGEGAMELSFVWSDMLTDLERAADHCCNIMECVADLSAGNRNLHAAQLAVRQRDPAFDSRVRAYEQKYRI
jgi:phosphate:Na+ symporter